MSQVIEAALCKIPLTDFIKYDFKKNIPLLKEWKYPFAVDFRGIFMLLCYVYKRQSAVTFMMTFRMQMLSGEIQLNGV